MRSPAVALIRIVALGMVGFALLVSGATPAYAWGYPAVLNTNAATDSGTDWRPQVTTDGGGNWVTVWESDDSLGDTIGTDLDILVSRSTDNGASWTDPAALNTNAATDSGYDHDLQSQVTTDRGDNWLAVWAGQIGGDADILVSRSTDNGASWTDPAALNTNAATDSESDRNPQVTTDGGGNWVAVWDSGDPSISPPPRWAFDIMVARSTDNGATWTAPTPLNSNAATDSGDDGESQVTSDGGDNWVAVWESADSLSGTIDTDYDILVARSTDNGATWSNATPLNTNAASDSGDDESPQVGTDGGGKWVAVWHSKENLGGTIDTDYDILVARSTDHGATWTAPAALNTNAATDSRLDVFPQVTTDGGGKWLTVWESHDSLGGTIGTDADILMAHSTDNGATWTAPTPLNTNAATDSGWDYRPQVATEGGGNWVAVWESSENLGSTIGTDLDILYATEYIPPYPPVGGIAKLPDVSDSSTPSSIALAALAAAALAALTAGAWYARRRWVR